MITVFHRDHRYYFYDVYDALRFINSHPVCTWCCDDAEDNEFLWENVKYETL